MREKIRIADSNNNSNKNTETDESDDSSAEEEVDSRLVFSPAVPDDTPMQKKTMIEWKKISSDDVASKREFERVSHNWIECKVKRKKSHVKNESH